MIERGDPGGADPAAETEIEEVIVTEIASGIATETGTAIETMETAGAVLVEATGKDRGVTNGAITAKCGPRLGPAPLWTTATTPTNRNHAVNVVPFLFSNLHTSRTVDCLLRCGPMVGKLYATECVQSSALILGFFPLGSPQPMMDWNKILALT